MLKTTNEALIIYRATKATVISTFVVLVIGILAISILSYLGVGAVSLGTRGSQYFILLIVIIPFIFFSFCFEKVSINPKGIQANSLYSNSCSVMSCAMLYHVLHEKLVRFRND